MDLKYKALGEFLRKRRVRLNLSQKEVCDKLGYSSGQFLSNIERGAAPIPDDILLSLCRLYKMEPMELLTECLKSEKIRLSSVLKINVSKTSAG